MNSLKAIVAGTLFIIVVTLLVQLVFLMSVVGYNNLAKDYSFLNDISGIFKYLIGIPVFIGIMFTGGYITAVIAKTNVLLHCFIVAVITIGGTMWMALENSDITLTGIAVNLLLLVATMAGGYIRLKRRA